MNAAPVPRLSVVLPVCGDVPAHQLAACLRSLDRQTLPPAQYEILLTGDAAASLPLPPVRCAVRVVSEERPCPPARACTLGVQAAAGEIVLLLRPDVLAGPDCLRLHLETHEAVPHAEYGVLGRVDLPATGKGSMWSRLLEVCGLFATAPVLANGALCGFEQFAARNLSLPRRSVVAAGLFDERLCEPEWGLEVQELGLRLQQASVPAAYVQACLVTLQQLPDLDFLCRASRQRGADLARMQARHAGLTIEPTPSAVDLQFWRSLPSRLTARVQALTDRLRPLESLPADPTSPSLPTPAAVRASLGGLGGLSRLRTREILALLDSLEAPLAQGLREDTALPAVLFLIRFHELAGFFAVAAAVPPVDIAATTRPLSRGRVLLATNYFWPSVGGTELLVEELGLRLMDAGFAVDVACRHLDARTVFSRKGMPIHAFRCWGGVNAVDGPDVDAYRRLICSGDYQAMIVLAHPDIWCCSLLRGLPPQRRPRIIMMPSMNADNLATWEASGELAAICDVLRAADVHVTVSERGVDAAILTRLGMPQVFLPHAVTDEAAPVRLRQRLHLPEDEPLLACVGNYWPVKNQLGLLRTMTAAPGRWRLVLAGAQAPWPDKRPYFMECWELARRDPRMRTAGPLRPLEAAALIREADILLVPSLGESAGPLVVLQAMALGTPWIATPACNAVPDEAGGLIAPLERFPEAVAALLAHPEAASELAALGREHWQRCFTWERSLDGFIDLIEGRLPAMDLHMPEELRHRWHAAARDLAPGLPFQGMFPTT